MLKFLSKRKRSRKVLLWGFIALLALGLIGIFTPAWSGLKGAASDDTAVAQVGSYEVSLKEFRMALSAYGQQIARGQGASRVDDPGAINAVYGPVVLDGLIRRKLILYEADRLNLQTSDEEVQERLKQQFAPWPGAEQYRLRLRQFGMTPVEFEDELRATIAQEKLRSYITAAAQVSPQEVEEEYRRNNTNYTVRWVEVNPDRFRNQVQVSDADLRAYYDQRKADFRVNDEQRRARYIFIDQNKAGETIQVPDDELRQAFDPEKGVQQVRVSQIVINIPKAKPEADQKTFPEDEARAKAEATVKRAEGAEGKPAEEFAKLAREVSEDARSRASGGDIGWVNKKDKRDTDDPLNRVFTMEKDKVSQPIRKGDKFYILKVTDRRLPTFEESREQLLKEARVRKGYSKAVEIATEAEQRFKETKNADAAIAEINKKFGAQVAVVKETPFFAEDDSLPDLGTAPELQSAIFELANTGDITERMNVNNGFAIAQYTDRRDPHDADFEEVKTKVEERFRADKAKDLASERARQLAQAQTPDGLKSAAESMKLKAEERSVGGNDSIGPLVSEATRLRVHKVNPGEVLHEPIKADNTDAQVVVSMVSRKDADMGEPFQKERKSIEQRLLDAKREALFSAYLNATQKRLKDEGKIEIYQDVIDSAPSLNASMPGARPGQNTTFPISPGSSRPRRRPQGLPTGQ